MEWEDWGGLVELILHPTELEEQEAFPRKEPEEELKEQASLPILHQKKEEQVIPPQLALEQVPQELGEE